MDKTDSQTNRWVERPWAARAVRVTVYVIPLALSIIASLTLTSMLAAPMSLTWSVIRWVLIVAVSTGVLVGTERVSRRLLPLATLFKLTLAFPDKVPSRYAIALRIGTTAQLQQRIAAAQRGEIAESPGEAAEQLLELVGLLSHHDRLTRGHSERVRAYTHLVGVEMGISGEALDRLRWSALLHDVGKITIPGTILNKPGRLTDDEFDTIKTHPLAGKKLVEPLSEWLGESVRAVWEHHERYDGGGYPQGLAGADISLAARVVCVTDAFDVMTSARSYKKPMTAAAARAELSRCAGTQFDPTVVRAFVAASIGTTQTATKPLALFAQLFLLPRTFLANATASLGVIAAVAAGAVVGTVGHSLAVERPPTVSEQVTVDESVVASESSSRAPGAGPDVTETTATGPTAPAVSPDASAPTTSGGQRVVDPDDLSGSNADPEDTVPDTAQPPGIQPPTPPPDVAMPGTSIPGASIPGTSIPGTSIPATVPGTVTVPVVTIPPLTIPIVTVTLPGVVISVPPLTVPSITVPPLTVPPITVPPLTVPPVTVPPLTVPPVTVPPVTVPSITVPPVTVPGGLF